jgi:hypothetical protein
MRGSRAQSSARSHESSPGSFIFDTASQAITDDGTDASRGVATMGHQHRAPRPLSLMKHTSERTAPAHTNSPIGHGAQRAWRGTPPPSALVGSGSSSLSSEAR